MAAVNLSGIEFRTYGFEENESPLSPVDYSDTVGAINLSGIRVRTYEEEQEEE